MKQVQVYHSILQFAILERYLVAVPCGVAYCCHSFIICFKYLLESWMINLLSTSLVCSITAFLLVCILTCPQTCQEIGFLSCVISLNCVTRHVFCFRD